MQSSNKLNAATSPSVIGSSSGGTYSISTNGTTTYTLPQSIYTLTGAASAGAVTITLPEPEESITFFSAESTLNWRCTDEELTPIFYERIEGQRIRAELQPEVDIRPLEQLRINMLIAYPSHHTKFKPITLIRRYNLERHFKFSAE